MLRRSSARTSAILSSAASSAVTRLMIASAVVGMGATAVSAATVYTATPIGLYSPATWTYTSPTFATDGTQLADDAAAGVPATASSATFSYVGPNGATAEAVTADSNGYAVGTARMFLNGTSTVRGQSAWGYSATLGSIKLGYTVDTASDIALGFSYTVAATGQVGEQTSTVAGVSANGYAAGTSLVYRNTTPYDSSVATDAWVANLNTGATTQVGLLGSDYVSVLGYRISTISAVGSNGVVAGISTKYSATTGFAAGGNSAWVYNPANPSAGTVQIGLISAPYLGNNSSYPGNYTSSTIFGVTSNGTVGGTSWNFTNSNFGLNDAWIYTSSGGTTKASPNVPLYQGDTIVGFNNAGMAGTTGLIANSSYKIAWVDNGGNPVQVGLTGTGYKDTTGGVTTLGYYAANGSAAGTSTIYLPYTDTTSSAYGTYYAAGADAWVYNGSQTVQVGLSNLPEYTGAGTFAAPVTYQQFVFSPHGSYYVTATATTTVRSAAVLGLSSTGYAIGTQAVYNGLDQYGGSVSVGKDAWVYNPVTNTSSRIGLTGVGYTSSDGISRTSTPAYVNSKGYVAGTSTIYAGTATAGSAAWAYTPATGLTAKIGLYDAAHTATDGTNSYQASNVTAETNSGWVAGYSTRYSGISVTATATSISPASSLGQDAWVYNADTKEFDVLSLATSDSSYFTSSISYLGENGLVLGTYATSNGGTTSLFVWSPGSSMMLLASDIVSNPTTAQWASLAALFGVDGNGDLFGTGLLAGQSLTYNSFNNAAAFILTPTAAVPEPASLGLLGAAAGLLAIRRRRSM